MDSANRTPPPPPPGPLPLRGRGKRVAERYVLPCGTVIEERTIEGVLIRDDGVLVSDTIREILPAPDFGRPFRDVRDAVRCSCCQSLISRSHTAYRCDCGEEFCVRCRCEAESEKGVLRVRCPYCHDALQSSSFMAVIKQMFLTIWG